MLSERTGLSEAEIASRVDAMFVTLGAEGSRIHADRRVFDIPTCEPSALVDPTGCGDAYRAGLLYGIGNGWDWDRTGRLASLLGSLKIASRGGQNHVVDREALEQTYRARYGHRLW